jgi:hypothetical protein
MNWNRFRKALPHRVGVTLLAATGGWAAYSGSMALAWLLHPAQKNALDQHVFFFPPLFGNSPILYLIAAGAIVVACGVAALLLKEKTTKANDV